MARYAGIRLMDVSDGPGIRVGVYFQGCPFKCKGCWNASTWDENLGLEWTQELEDKVIEECGKPMVAGLSLLGGEPLYKPNYQAVLKLIKRFKKEYPDKTIWIWSGQVWEHMNEEYKYALSYCDVLVDGPFMLDKRDFTLKYAGSTNQRVIDLKKNFATGGLVLWEDVNVLGLDERKN